MSPRRSSRARSTQILPSANSSSSSNSNSKVDRSARPTQNGHTRTASPRRGSTVRSESLDDAESMSRGINAPDSALPPRRSRRGNDSETNKEKDMKTVQEGDDDDEAVEEDVTRCICGQPDYPGPGASVKEQLNIVEPISDDVGNFFVQCDKCHVWQHGGCMGLTDESMLPEEYYCETCRPEFHRIIKGITGIKSSRYLPILEGVSPRSSPLSSTDAPRKGNGKNKSLDQTKRRATMNSRGAYDEDEMLRRAIEESKEIVPLTGTLGKRTRDDMEDHKPTIKRQRTASSVSSLGSQRSLSPHPTTEDGSLRLTMNGTKSSSKLRGAAAKNSREKELREKQKEQVAALRAEAASKRHARSERRRGDESPPPTPSLSPSKLAQSTGNHSRSKAETPPSSKAHLGRKGGRPAARRGRLGRNQYTRDLPLNGETSDSPHRDTSHDRRGNDSPRPHTNGLKDNINGESGRSSKAKTHPARTSMNEMKRRVAAILEFVGRMQTERGTTQPQVKDSSRSSGSSSLKGTSTPNGTNMNNLPTAGLVKAVTEGLEEANELKKQTAAQVQAAVDEGEDTISVQAPRLEVKPEKEFDEMNSMDMMENLTKELVAWQSVYGTYAR